MRSMGRVAAQVACAVATLALTASCGAQTLSPGGSTAALQLPELPSGLADRKTDVLTPNAMEGRLTHSRSATGAVDSGTGLALTSLPNATAWGMYRFSPGTNTLKSLAWDVYSPAGQGVFLALANYATGRWVMAGPSTTGQTMSLGAANLSPAGNMYALAIVFGGASGAVTGLTITTDNPVQQFTVSGTVNSGGSPLAGVSVSLTGQGSVTTAANGTFSFANVPNGSYTLTPTLSGYTFSPTSRSVTVSGANVVAQDFNGTQAVTYTNRIQALLTSNCTSCHGGNFPSGGIRLDSYANAKAIGSTANARIQEGTMPPTGPLNAADKAAFQAWVNAGYPQ